MTTVETNACFRAADTERLIGPTGWSNTTFLTRAA